MARIPDDELQRIKSQVKLEDLCRDYGIELKSMGPDNLMGLCPFHDDHTPSFGVTPSKNLWNCLAGCGGGDAIELVIRKQSVSFRRAVDILRRRLGMAPETPTLKTRKGTAHSMLVPPSETELADHVVLQHVIDFYHQTFCDEVKAMRYLQERRCFDVEAVKHFRIGYANRTLGYRVPTTTAAGAKLKDQLQRLGIFRASGHEHLSGSVVFPILDEHGNPGAPGLQLYGRKITANLREGTPLHLYLPGEHRAVWNAAALRAAGGQKEWLLCESLIDGLTLWCAGFRNVTCAYGVHGFTEAHWKLIEELQPKRIIICYDNDPAGNAAAAKLAEQLRARGIEVVRAKLPPGKDINNVACMNKDARIALAIALETGGDPWAHSIPSMPAPTIIEATKEQPPVAAPTPSPMPASEDAIYPTGSPADEVTFTFGPRQWRVRGVGKNLGFDTLRVQLRVLVQNGEQSNFHLDNLDLCNAKQRQSFVALAHAETQLDQQLLKRDLAQVFLKVEELQEKCIRAALEPKQKEVVVPDAERQAALELLRDPKLLDRILTDFDRCGVVGEQVNKLVGCLATISRKLDEPLAVIVQSASAAGKSSLMEAILAFVPEEQRVK